MVNKRKKNRNGKRISTVNTLKEEVVVGAAVVLVVLGKLF